MRILASPMRSGGPRFSVQFELPPHAKGPPLHYHDAFAETFIVEAGEFEMTVGKERQIRVLKAGEKLHVPEGMIHTFRNASPNPVRFVTHVEPPGEFEKFIRVWYGLGAASLTNREGVPRNPLHLALALHWGNVIMVGPPVFLQRIVFGPLLLLARISGAERFLARFLPPASVQS